MNPLLWHLRQYKWLVILERRSMYENHEDSLDILEIRSFSLRTIQVGFDDVAYGIQVIRSDHNEGIWKKTIP